jgi:hypothetical protein
MGYGSMGGDSAAAAEEALPDDVPLTRTQLQAKVGGYFQPGSALIHSKHPIALKVPLLM